MRASLALAALLALSLAGCSDPGDGHEGHSDTSTSGPGAGATGTGTGSASATGTGSSTATMTGAPAPTSAEVVLSNNQFSPREVTVQVGGTVRWVTQDAANRHNVVSTSEGNEFRSPDMDALLPLHDREYSYTFQAAGTVDYVCEYHSGMVGKVLVVA